MEWLLSYMHKKWPYKQVNRFDQERLYPIYYAFKLKYGLLQNTESHSVLKPENVKPIFYPHDGIRPFWQLHISSINSE